MIDALGLLETAEHLRAIRRVNRILASQTPNYMLSDEYLAAQYKLNDCERKHRRRQARMINVELAALDMVIKYRPETDKDNAEFTLYRSGQPVMHVCAFDHRAIQSLIDGAAAHARHVNFLESVA